jgi:hypothetical protein
LFSRWRCHAGTKNCTGDQRAWRIGCGERIFSRSKLCAGDVLTCPVPKTLRKRGFKNPAPKNSVPNTLIFGTLCPDPALRQRGPLSRMRAPRVVNKGVAPGYSAVRRSTWESPTDLSRNCFPFLQLPLSLPQIKASPTAIRSASWSVMTPPSCT